MRRLFSKFLLTAGTFILLGSNVSAEQPKAQEYREILSSEKFYVEYEDEYTKKIVVEDSGRRMFRVDLNSSKKAMISVLNPLANLFGSSFSKYPDFMYYKGKYYKFLDKSTAIMAKEDQLYDKNLNPSEGWSLIERELSLPDELAVFNWNDTHHKPSENISEPVFIDTIQKNVAGKDYTCDRYESEVKNSKDAKMIFDMCYENGELVFIQSSILTNNREYGVNKLFLKKILPEIPKGVFILNEKAKIYAAGRGDMDDLLENPKPLGILHEVE